MEFKIGDQVCILRFPTPKEINEIGGSSKNSEGYMDYLIITIETIIDIDNINVIIKDKTGRNGKWWIPYYCVEKVNPIPKLDPIPKLPYQIDDQTFQLHQCIINKIENKP